MYQPHARHADPPPYHDDGQKHTGPQLFEQHIGERLKHGVANEENGQAVVVLGVGYAKVFLQAVNLCIANVCTVKEGNQIEEREPGNEA